MEEKNVNVSIVVTPSMRKVLDLIVRDTHISYGDFFRDAARDKIRREYPKHAEKLGLTPISEEKGG